MARESEVEIGAAGTQPHDPGKESVTAFISNLDYSLGEDRIREIFSKVCTSFYLEKSYFKNIIKSAGKEYSQKCSQYQCVFCIFSLRIHPIYLSAVFVSCVEETL